MVVHSCLLLIVSSAYPSILGLYRCIATNSFGKHEFSIQFQRPSIPDPPTRLNVINITHSSFIVEWQPGYHGGSDQTFHVILYHSHSEERYTTLNSIQFKDLNEKTRYVVKIRSKNQIGFSDYSNSVVIVTKESPIRSDEFPIIKQAYVSMNDNRLYYELGPMRSMLLSLNQLCIQYFNADDMSPCVSLISPKAIDDGIKIDSEQSNLRLKLCLINQTDICSKSIPISTRIPLASYSSELLVLLIGKKVLDVRNFSIKIYIFLRRSSGFIYCICISCYIYLYSHSKV